MTPDEALRILTAMQQHEVIIGPKWYYEEIEESIVHHDPIHGDPFAPSLFDQLRRAFLEPSA